MMFFWVIVLGAVIWYVARQSTSSKTNHNNTTYAMNILDQRFAKGEIDESTYKKMKKQIEEGKE